MAALKLSSKVALMDGSREWVRSLAAHEIFESFYLAGSAALALYLEHRTVRDLDLMSLTDRLKGPSRRDLLETLLRIDPDLRVETARDGYLFARTSRGAALRFFYYPYPLVDPQQELDGLDVASAVDLGLMKLAAIISRGTRRDFVDLFLLGRKLPLDELLERSQEKFGHVLDFPLQALKALVDFSLVDGEPMPRLDQGVEELAWQEVEAWFRGQVETLGRRHVGLS